jgi:hypothetical protein
VRGLLIVAIGLIVLSNALTLGAGINQKTTDIVRNVTTTQSQNFNDTITAAGNIQVTTAQFMTLPVIAFIGAISLAAIASLIFIFGGMGGRGF